MNKLFAVTTLAATLCSTALPSVAGIIGISIPVNSQDATSHPLIDDVWSVSVPPYPLNTNIGIGYIVNPTFPLPSSSSNQPDFSLHDHVYLSSNVPDPMRATVTYQFDVPTIIKAVEVVQHTNGISQIEGFSGDSLITLTSLGSVFGPSGDILGSLAFTEYQSQIFDFGNTVNVGTFFELTVRKTSLDNGWANYRIFPLDANGNRIPPATNASPVPEPSSVLLLMSGISAFAFAVRRQKSEGKKEYKINA